MRIVLEYAKKHNATISFIENEENQWGDIYDNWTGNGILGDLVMNHADLGFGALYSWYRVYSFLDFSMPVVRTGITCLAPAPFQQRGLLVPFFPFQPVVWITVLTSFLILFILYVLIYKLYYNRKNRLNMSNSEILFQIFMAVFRIFVLQSLPSLRAFKRSLIRCLLTSTLIFSLLLATCYQSGLASNMTMPRYNKAIHTIEDLAESNLAWGATNAAWVFSLQSITEPPIVDVANNFQIKTKKQLQQRLTTRDFAFPIERLPFGHYAISEFMTSEEIPYLLIMSEDIYWEQCVIMASKSSPYIPGLNDLILRIHESGLPYIWETFVVMKYLDNKVQMAVHVGAAEHHATQKPIKLNFNHVVGAVVIWAAGNFIAFIIFIGEIIHYKYYYH